MSSFMRCPGNTIRHRISGVSTMAQANAAPAGRSGSKPMMTKSVAIGFAAMIAAAPVATGQVVGIGTNPQGTQFYNMSVAMGKVVSDKTDLQVRVQPIGGTSQLMPQLD